MTDDELADWIERHEEQQQRQQAEALRSFAALCEPLAELGVEEVRIPYDGYGDSGTVEGVTAIRGGNEVELTEDLSEALIAAAESLLPAGWQDNAGAFGRLRLDVAARALARDHHWRVETTEHDEESWNL